MDVSLETLPKFASHIKRSYMIGITYFLRMNVMKLSDILATFYLGNIINLILWQF